MDIDIDKLVEDNKGKFKANKNPIVAIVLIVIGLVIAYVPVLADFLKDMSIVIASMGVMLMIFGFCATFLGKSSIVYLPTNEKLKKKEYLFDKEFSSEKIEQLMKSELFDEMEKNSSKNPNAQHVVVVYRTTSNKCVISQHFKYVPYQYEPASEVMVSLKD